MATLSQGKSNFTYLTVSKGKLIQRVNEYYEGDNVIERKLEAGPNKGKIVREIHYTEVEGYITNVEIRRGDYGDQITLQFDDNIKVQFSDNDFNNVVNTLLNIDLNKKVTLQTYVNSEGYGRFVFKQDGQMVGWAVTKDNPMGCPQPVQKEIRGEVKWDWTDVNNWFYDKLQEYIMKNFPEGARPVPKDAEYTNDTNIKKANLSQELEHNEQFVPSIVNQEQEINKEIKEKKNNIQDQEENLSVEDVPFN